MLSLRTMAAVYVAAITHSDYRLKELLCLRLKQLDGGSDAGELIHIVVFEENDNLNDIKAVLGFNPVSDEIDNGGPGEFEVSSGWEWITQHEGWIEIVYIFSDEGNGAILFVNENAVIAPFLIDLCDK